MQTSPRRAPEHPAPRSRLPVTPGAALTRTRGLQSSGDRLGRRMRRDRTEGRQAGAWATYGHPGRDTEGQRRRAASAAPASGEPRGGSIMAHRGAWRGRPSGAQRGGTSTAWVRVSPRPHAGGPRSRRRRQETRQPSGALRLLPAAAPVICAGPHWRLVNWPKPRAAPGPPRGCNLRPRPRSPPRPRQSPHLPGPDPLSASPASCPPLPGCRVA